MRVISGTARSLPLKAPPGLDTRPTSDKIKETLFNILSPYIQGASFLDLFAGSGAIGIEALSRGASYCAFAETDPKAARCIIENLEFTRLKNKSEVFRKNALSAISELSLKGKCFDIVYLDPPYKSRQEEPALRALACSGIIDEASLVICEAAKENDMSFLKNLPFAVTREKNYKTNKHFFLKLKT